MQKVKDVAHKMGIGHTGEAEPGTDRLGSSYQNVGATYGAEGASGIAAPIAPGTATTASNVAAAPPMGKGSYTTTGYGASTGYGAEATTDAGVPVAATEGGGIATCAAETFTKVEDRPVVKERVELVQEHRPMEKEFVVETRATGGEREVAGGEVEHLGTTERVVAAQGPKAPCE